MGENLEKCLGISQMEYIQYLSEYRERLFDFYMQAKEDKVYPENVFITLQEDLNLLQATHFPHIKQRTHNH